MKMRWFLVITFPLMLQGQDSTEFRIRYVAADNVYITAGRQHGLMIGDTLTVTRNQIQIARIRVTYAASRTASCRIIQQSEELQTGDAVSWAPRELLQPVHPEKPPLRQRRRTIPVDDRKDRSSGSDGTVRGSLALSYYHFHETRTGTDLLQPALTLRLRNDRSPHPGLHFSLRLRSRMNKRSYRFSDAPEVEWRNRLYEISLSNGDDKDFQVKAGRILSRKFSGVGYIDGLMLQQRVRGGVSAGVFGGIQPRWQFLETTETIQKYGAYLRYQSPADAVRRVEWTIAGAGAYAGNTISREFIYLQSSFSGGNTWRLYQSLELDINRNWRRERAGQTVSVTGVYLSAFGRLSPQLTLNLSADTRQNYYTHAWISMADSLFDSAFRRGVRGSLQGRLNKYIRWSLSGGLRKTEHERRMTQSVAGHMMLRNLPWRGFLASIRYSRFENRYSGGNYLNFRLGHNLKSGHGVSIEYGQNDYRYHTIGSDALNHWIRLDIQLIPLRWWYLNLNGEHDWGDDIAGRRIYMDMGIRF